MSAWVLGLGLVCAVLFAGQGGLLKTLLELPFWSVLARLTYSVYLVHPMTIWVILASRGGQPYHFSLVALFSDFVGFSAMSAIAGLVFFFLVEAPFGEFERLIFKGGSGASRAVEKQLSGGGAGPVDGSGRGKREAQALEMVSGSSSASGAEEEEEEGGEMTPAVVTVLQ